MKNAIVKAIKKETVLCIACILALVSMFFVHPDKQYIDYIDVRTLIILFCLMAVVAGLKELGLFDYIAQKLLKRIHRMWQVALVMVLFCFLFSMVITNDVALITFVPLCIIILGCIGEEQKKKWLIPIVAMQTVAANLGSMLTPIGNPQNLYLYGQAKMGVGEFVQLMLPYTLFALLLLLVWIACSFVKEKGSGQFSIHLSSEKKVEQVPKCLAYFVLFVVCLLTVAHLMPVPVSFGLVLVFTLLFDRRILRKVDYSLLGTFVGFFIFIGNLGRIPAFSQFLSNAMEGREIVTSVLASQVMSNVPAALLLSGFTDNYSLLIIGTNLGGLGTLIASMASLISFKYVAKEDKDLRGKYLLYFTISNVVFLGCYFLFLRLM